MRNNKSKTIFGRVNPFLGRPLARSARIRRAARGPLSANPSHPPMYGRAGNAEVGAQPEVGPDRLEVGPVDAERLADQERLGDLPARPARVVPAAIRAGRGRSGRRDPRRGRRGSRGCCRPASGSGPGRSGSRGAARREPGELFGVGQQLEEGRGVDPRRLVEVGVIDPRGIEGVVHVPLQDQAVDGDLGLAGGDPYRLQVGGGGRSGPGADEYLSPPRTGGRWSTQRVNRPSTLAKVRS